MKHYCWSYQANLDPSALLRGRGCLSGLTRVKINKLRQLKLALAAKTERSNQDKEGKSTGQKHTFTAVLQNKCS